MSLENKKPTNLGQSGIFILNPDSYYAFQIFVEVNVDVFFIRVRRSVVSKLKIQEINSRV